MRARSFHFVLLSSLASAFVGTAAWADASPCVADQDCGHGFTCQVVGGTACSSRACKPGDECAPAPPCEAGVIMGCVPGPCASDSDCPTNMVCQASTSTACSGATLAPCFADGGCPVSDPPTCTTVTTHSCVPRYLAPCEVNADCGPTGFTCQAEGSCSCAGGGGASSGAGTTPAPAPAPHTLPAAMDAGEAQTAPVDAGTSPTPDCTCVDAGVSACVLQDIPCDSAADCPSDWTCEAQVSPPICPGLALADGAAPDCRPPATSSSRCLPPYWNATLSTGHTPAEDNASSAGGGGANTTPSAPTGGTPNATAAPAGGAGGCSITNNPGEARASGASWALWGLGAMLALTSRRRRRANRTTD